MYQGAIFDLDGVLVDTAKYHFLAWQALAQKLGIHFTERDNERLKGVSRMASLDVLLSLGDQQYDTATKEKFAQEKNDLYVSYIEKMDATEILPGVTALLTHLQQEKIKICLGSASKNAPLILKRTGLDQYFDAIVDGNDVQKAKPDPEVFLKGAEKLGLAPAFCVVFEDALAGCEAGKAGGMYVVGVGTKENLPLADEVHANLVDFTGDHLFQLKKL